MPATGCAGHEMARRAADAAATCAITDGLDRADIGDDGARRQRRPRSRPRPRRIAPTGTHRMTRSASARRVGRIARRLVGEAELAHPRRSSPASAVDGDDACAARPCWRAARAIDEPIRPKPMMARRSKSGVRAVEPSRSGIGRLQEIAQAPRRRAGSPPRSPTVRRSAFGRP